MGTDMNANRSVSADDEDDVSDRPCALIGAADIDMNDAKEMFKKQLVSPKAETVAAAAPTGRSKRPRSLSIVAHDDEDMEDGCGTCSISMGIHHANVGGLSPGISTTNSGVPAVKGARIG